MSSKNSRQPEASPNEKQYSSATSENTTRKNPATTSSTRSTLSDQTWKGNTPSSMNVFTDMQSTQPWTRPMSMSSEESSSKSPAQSSRGGSSRGGSFTQTPRSQASNTIERYVDKAKSKLSRRTHGAEILPDDEQDFEHQKAKAIEKQRREEEYERLKLKDRTVFGMGGSGGFGSG